MDIDMGYSTTWYRYGDIASHEKGGHNMARISQGIYICMHACMYMYICRYIYMCTYMNIWITYMHACIYTHTQTIFVYV